MTTKTDTEQHRAAFEAWYEQEFAELHGPLVWIDGDYENTDHSLMFAAYRAGRAALQSKSMPSEISRDLLGGIVDQVFGGAIEDTTVIEDIYCVIAREFALQSQDRDELAEKDAEIRSLEHELAAMRFRLQGMDMRPQEPIARRDIDKERI